jgi:hypothetical protein
MLLVIGGASDAVGVFKTDTGSMLLLIGGASDAVGVLSTDDTGAFVGAPDGVVPGNTRVVGTTLPRQAGAFGVKAHGRRLTGQEIVSDGLPVA